MNRSRARAAQFRETARPWAYTLPLGPAIFDLYDSLGDVTVSAPTSVPGETNGPAVVQRYGTLTLNAVLTGPQCRAFVLLADWLNIGASGGVSMTGKGAAGGASWPNYDLSMPASVALSGCYMDRWAYLAAIRKNNWFVGDPILAQRGRPELGDVVGTIAPGVVLLNGAGCGAGGAGAAKGLGSNVASGSATGSGGGVGSLAPGGGGGGGATLSTTGVDDGGASGGAGGPGRPWSGGDGGLSGLSLGAVGAGGFLYGGKNTRPGGTLLVLVRYGLTLATGYTITANGLSTEGGVPGGGFVGIACGGPVTIAGVASNVSAIAATASPGAASSPGGSGGQGAVVRKTWADLGWA